MERDKIKNLNELLLAFHLRDEERIKEMWQDIEKIDLFSLSPAEQRQLETILKEVEKEGQKWKEELLKRLSATSQGKKYLN